MTAITETDAEVDVLTAVTRCVAALSDELPAIMEACTDPEGLDLAELLWHVRTARVSLAAMERQVETATAAAMLAGEAETPTLRVERTRARDRKAWDHEAWRRDVRRKALQATGLKGAQGVLTADGEVVPVSVIVDAMHRMEAAHASAPPRLTGLRALGLDPEDYCETSPGGWRVKVTRMHDENEGDE